LWEECQYRQYLHPKTESGVILIFGDVVGQWSSERTAAAQNPNKSGIDYLAEF
jgi:hypothetical protein